MTSILNLFRPSNNTSNDDIDFGARFLRPPPVSTKNLVVDSPPGRSSSPTSHSTVSNMAKLLSKLNLGGAIGSDRMSGLNKFGNKKVLCSTPIDTDKSQRTNGCSFSFNFPPASPPPPDSPPGIFDTLQQTKSMPTGYPSKFAGKASLLNHNKSNLLNHNTSNLLNLNKSNLLNLNKSKLLNHNSFSSDGQQSDEDSITSNSSQLRYTAYTGVYMENILRQAKAHRTAASFSSARCTWRGQLTTRNHRNAQLSSKVFLGGVPWDVTEANLVAIFSKFGPIKVQWPGREVRCSLRNSPSKCGYVYIVFNSQDSVQALLNDCTYDNRNGGRWLYIIPTKRAPAKEVQVIPWVLADSNWVKNPSQRLDPGRTVFVGALHGMITAESLARIMNDLFNDVVYVGIDTDKQKYPLGSARVSFSNTQSYLKAVCAGFVEIKCNKFNKKVPVVFQLTFCFSFALFLD